MSRATPSLPGFPLLRLATPHARKKGHAPWDPRDGTQKRLLADALEVFEEYRNHLPLGVRAVGYQIKPKWVPDHYENKTLLVKALDEVLVKARRARIIPWEWVDDQRTAMAAPWTVADLPGVVREMQANRQKGQPYRTEVWVEAKGNLSRIGNICDPYGITVLSGSGSVPTEAIRQAAIRVVRTQKRWQQPSLFLVVSDFDHHGVKNIAMALEADVRAFVSDFGGDNDGLIVRQVALTEEQALALPVHSREKLTGKTPKDWPQPFKMEVEAIPPDQLDGLIEDALAMVRDEDALATAMAAEPELRRRAVRRLADELEEDGE